MRRYEEQCERLIRELTGKITEIEKLLKESPEGCLKVQKTKKWVQYYQRTDAKDTHGVYIKKSEEELAKKLAQKEYMKKVLPLAIKKRKELEEHMRMINIDDLLEVYEKLSEERKHLVEPLWKPDNEYVEAWILGKKRRAKNKRMIIDYEDGILTEQGELVRSKSEKILADKLFFKSVPYVYEAPIDLQGFGTIYPDFTVLNKRTREEFFWEHFGLMDDPAYCEKAIKKITTYQKNGIYQGKTLLTTYETKNYAPNILIIESLIAEYLI